MSEHINNSSELPQILFTPQALEIAQATGIVDIVPNPDHIIGIGELVAETFPEHTFPETLGELWVVIRNGRKRPGRWDAVYGTAPQEQPYYDRSELTAGVLNRTSISKENLSAARRVAEMTIFDWQTDNLAEKLSHGLMYRSGEVAPVDVSPAGILRNVVSVLTTSRAIRDRERQKIEAQAADRYPEPFSVIYSK